MSYRVLVIPEDPTNNGYILKPLVKRMLTECGKPKARVEVLTNPRAGGYESAHDLLKEEILDRYADRDLLLFLPDADGKDRSRTFKSLEALAHRKKVTLICCAAVQEVETWLLAGHLEKLKPMTWDDIRADCSVKENTFDKFLAKHGDPRSVGNGRGQLMEETLKSYAGLLTRCPELKQLQDRISLLRSPPGDGFLPTRRHH